MSFLHVIKSTSYNTDGRLLKWLESLNRYKEKSMVYIIEDDNHSSKDENIFRDRLIFRKIFRKRTGYVLKVMEYLFRFIGLLFSNQVKNVNVIVFHDVQQYANLYFSIAFRFFHKKAIIWDLHELPHQYFEKYSILRSFIRFLITKSDLTVFTNIARKDYVFKIYNIKNGDFFVLNNYPNTEYNFQKQQKLEEEIELWLDSQPYILWLGAGAKVRNFDSFLKGYDNLSKRFKLIVLGKVESDFTHQISILKAENKVKVLFVKQSEMIQYIDNAAFSVVMYNSFSMNNYMCEPNRLYQLLTRGIPVICGNNPPLAQAIEQVGISIVLEDDGRDSECLKKNMSIMANSFAEFSEILNKSEAKKIFNWDDQFPQIYSKIEQFK